MPKTRTQYSMINMAVNITGYIINTIMGFVCRIFFVRTLTTEYLGINGLFSNILSVLSLAELGIGAAIVYALYKPFAENDIKKVASLMKFYSSVYRVIGIVVAIIGVSLIPFLHLLIRETPNIKENIYIIYIAYIFNTCLTYFFSYRSSLLAAAQRSYIQTGLSYAITTLQSLLQIVVLITTKQYYLYLLIQTIGVFLYNIGISYWVKRDYPYIVGKNIEPLDKEEKKSLAKNIKALTVNKLSQVLVNSTDNIIITFFGGLVSVGSASNYVLFVTTLESISNQIFNSFTGSVGNYNATQDEKSRYKLFKTLQMYNYLVYGLAGIGIMFVASDLVNLFYGEKYVLEDKIPFILGINMYIAGMQNVVNMYRTTMGLFKYGQYTLLFTAALNIGFSLWLGNIWGVFGIYLATSLARILTNVWYIPTTVFKYGLNVNPIEYFKRYFKYLIAIAIEIIACYFLCNLVDFNNIINAIIKIIICVAVHAFVFVAMFFRTYEFKFTLERVKLVVSNKFKKS